MRDERGTKDILYDTVHSPFSCLANEHEKLSESCRALESVAFLQPSASQRPVKAAGSKSITSLQSASSSTPEIVVVLSFHIFYGLPWARPDGASDGSTVSTNSLATR